MLTLHPLCRQFAELHKVEFRRMLPANYMRSRPACCLLHTRKFEDAGNSRSEGINKSIAKIVNMRTQKRWSENEVYSLVSMRERRWRPSVIAKRLGRDQQAVVRVLDRLGEMGPQETSSELPSLSSELYESQFSSRLTKIWHGLRHSNMTELWRAALTERSDQEWLFHISNGLP